MLNCYHRNQVKCNFGMVCVECLNVVMDFTTSKLVRAFGIKADCGHNLLLALPEGKTETEVVAWHRTKYGDNKILCGRCR